MLRTYNIKHESKLDLVPRLRGGATPVICSSDLIYFISEGYDNDNDTEPASPHDSDYTTDVDSDATTLPWGDQQDQILAERQLEDGRTVEQHPEEEAACVPNLK